MARETFGVSVQARRLRGQCLISNYGFLAVLDHASWLEPGFEHGFPLIDKAYIVSLKKKKLINYQQNSIT